MTSVSDLNGLFKQVYGDGIVDLVPEAMHILNDSPFSVPSKRLGDKFHVPVIVSQEHGVTYAAPGSSSFSLNSAVTMKSQDAQVDAYQIAMRCTLDVESAARSASGGAAAFKEATQLQMENAMESASKRLEIACLYGQSGLAVTTGADSNVNSTTTTVHLTAASFAAGIWAGSENAQINFWTAGNALVSSASDSVFSIQSVDTDNRTLTVTGTATGITALDTAAGSGALTIYWNGARTGSSTYQEMAGLDKIITNAGSLFNIDAATYSLWKGNSYDVASGALTLAKLQSGIAKAVVRGLTEDVTVYVNPLTWGNLLSDEAGLRRYDSQYSKAEASNGMKKISFYSQNGLMDIVPHIFVKQGDAFAVPMKRVKRVGSCDLTFAVPGTGEIFFPLANSMGFEYRLYTAQSIFLETPARAVKFINIVNT